MTQTILYLVRHGETEWNRLGRWQGHADVPLAAVGRAQAEQLAQRLADEHTHIDQIHSSDLSRAWETAQIVARRLHLPVHVLPNLREIDVGSWSGLTRAEITTRWPGAFQTLHAAPDGEAQAAFWQRVMDGVCSLAAQHRGQRLLLVTHGGVIRALLGRIHTWHGEGNAHVPPITNASITEVHTDGTRWHIERVSDAAHVNNEPAQDVMAARSEGMLPQ